MIKPDVRLCFGAGMGPMPWTVNSEIYPLWARSTGNACSAGVNWICNVFVSLTFLHVAQYLTYYGTAQYTHTHEPEHHVYRFHLQLKSLGSCYAVARLFWVVDWALLGLLECMLLCGCWVGLGGC